MKWCAAGWWICVAGLLPTIVAFPGDANPFPLSDAQWPPCIDTIAGNGSEVYAGDGPALGVGLGGNGRAVAIESAGEYIYFSTVASSERVRRLHISSGMMTTIAGTDGGDIRCDGLLATSTALQDVTEIALAERRGVMFFNEVRWLASGSLRL